MFACFTFQLSSTLLLNNILLTLTRWFIGKQLLWRKFARNPLKTPVKEQQQKFTMHNLLHEILSTRNVCTISKLSEQLLRFPRISKNRLNINNLKMEEFPDCFLPPHYQIASRPSGLIFNRTFNFTEPFSCGTHSGNWFP